MPKQHAAVQTETVQEATTQTKAAMNLLALWSGKCSECSLPNPTLKRSASSPPDFGQWRMRDSVPGIITYPERFERCRGIVIDELKMNTHIEGGLENKGGLQSRLQQQHTLQQHLPQQTAAAARAAAASSGSTRRSSRRPVDFCQRSSRWRDAKGRYCRAPSPATGRHL